jgi:hypothetical protein
MTDNHVYGLARRLCLAGPPAKLERKELRCDPERVAAALAQVASGLIELSNAISISATKRS